MESIHLDNAFLTLSNLIRHSSSLYLGKYDSHCNQSGDSVKELDMKSHTILVDALQKCDSVKGYISEESDELCFLNQNGDYIVAFDPLDGSSNIEVNVSIGTIYGIYQWDEKNQSIGPIIDAGYCIYGPSTQWVKTEKDKVKMYQLNQHNQFEWIADLDLEGETKKMYSQKMYSQKMYSINESNSLHLSPQLNNLLSYYKKNNYNTRWVGSMVADCHRTLVKGGIFMYPMTDSHPNGKLRLAYESLPIAKIFEVAHGSSWDGHQSILDNTINPLNIHQKIPTFIGNMDEILILKSIYQK